MSYSPSQILIDQVTEFLTENLGRAPTAAEILNGLVAPWTLGNIHNTLQVPSTFFFVAVGGDIQSAIDMTYDSGGGTVLLEDGTHTLTANIEVPAGVTLLGTSRSSVIIDCGGFSIRLTGLIGDLSLNPILKNITVTNGDPGIFVEYTEEARLQDVIVYGCTTGIEILDSTAPFVNCSSFDNEINLSMERTDSFEINFSAFYNASVGNGVQMTDCSGATFFDSASYDNATNGLSLTGCSNIAFVSTSWETNGAAGVDLVSGNSDLQFTAATADGNTTDGYKLTDTSDRISISNTSIINNGAYGVDIADATCDNNTILGCFFDGNGTAAANDSGTGTLIRSNQGLSDSP